MPGPQVRHQTHPSDNMYCARIFHIKYGTPMPADLNDPVIDVYVDFDNTEQRTCEPGDRIWAVTGVVNASHGHALPAVNGKILEWNGRSWNELNKQPQPGDLVATTCTADDVAYISGTLAVVLADGTMRSTASSLVGQLMTMTPP